MTHALAPAFEDAFSRDVWSVLGVPVDRIDLHGAADLVETCALERRRLSFVTPNVNWLVRALKVPEARAQVIDADLSLADGAPVVALANALGAALPGRAAGSDLFNTLRARKPKARPLKVFFFGGRPGAAEAARDALNRDVVGLEACGALNPGHGDIASMSTPAILDRINAAEPDFVLVSLGAAKGQGWIAANQHALAAPVLAHLGAVVDFVAGTISRAPGWMASSGLEWAYRIVAEPSLWTRYARDGGDLAGLAATKLPAARAGAGDPDAALDAAYDEGVVRLAGSATYANRDALRPALRSAAGAGGDVILDVSNLAGLDAAAVGQILMLERALVRQGRALSAIGVAGAVAQAFDAHALPYRRL